MIEETIVSLAKEILNMDIPREDLDKNLFEIGISSVNFVNFLIEIEKEYHIEIDDDLFASDRSKSILDIVKYVSKIIESKCNKN